MVFSIIGIFTPDKEYLTTKGIIVDIEEYYDSIDDSNSYTTYIDYEVNGTKYEHVQYGSYNSSMKINDEIVVYYDPEDPTLIQAEGYKKVPYVVLGISTVFTIGSIITMIRR